LARATVGNSKKAGLRSLWLNIHLWLGVGLFVVLIPLGLSGSILVWDQSIERSLNAHRFEVSDSKAVLSPSTYVAAAETAFAGRAVTTTVRFPDKAGVPVTVVGQLTGPPGPNGRPRQLTAWLDPKTAFVTDVEEVAKSGFSVLHRVHGSLLIPNVGRKIVGWLGWAMTISSITGVILWWPRNNAFVKGLRWTRTPSTWDNLHHMIGFWVCLPLAILSLTGVYISFPQTSRAVFGQPTTSAPQRPRTPPAPLTETGLTVDEAVATAKADIDGAELLSVTYPTAGRTPTWRVELQGVKPPAKVFQVSDADRTVKADRGRPTGRAGQDPVSRLMRQVHDGAGTGPVWQTIIVIAGIAPSILGITGVVMWLKSRKRKAKLKPAFAAS
jgi:uncharacterized iron-regulated membrane protein